MGSASMKSKIKPINDNVPFIIIRGIPISIPYPVLLLLLTRILSPEMRAIKPVHAMDRMIFNTDNS